MGKAAVRQKIKRFCASALCASLILGNVGSVANASAGLMTGGEHGDNLASPSDVITATSSDADARSTFELDRAALYDALQEAIEADSRVELEFYGSNADQYEDFFGEADFYELKPEIKENDRDLELRIFARTGDVELLADEHDDYVIDGSEDLLFLLTNRSEENQDAMIQVENASSPKIHIAANPQSEDDVVTPETETAAEAAETVAEAAATPSDTEPEVWATPSDAGENTSGDTSDNTDDPDRIDGEVFDLTETEDGTAVGFLTTAGELKLDDLDLIASDSNALVRYSQPVEGAEEIVVDVKAKRGSIPEGAELRARYLTENGEEYLDAQAALDDAGRVYSGMLAMDIGFWLDGEEIEPQKGTDVQVKIRMNASVLPEDVDMSTLEVQHHAETELGVKVETVAAVSAEARESMQTMAEEAVPMAASLDMEEEIVEDAVDGSDAVVSDDEESGLADAEPGQVAVIQNDTEETVVAAFVVDGFSCFTITYNGNKKYIYFVDESGKQIPGDQYHELGSKDLSDGKWYSIEELIAPCDIKGYDLKGAYLGNGEGGAGDKLVKWVRYYNDKWDNGWRYSSSSENPGPNSRGDEMGDRNIYAVFTYTTERPGTVETVDISDKGITVNLFDYNKEDVNYEDHAFQFLEDRDGYQDGNGRNWNHYVQGVVQGVVQSSLGQDGYPQFAEKVNNTSTPNSLSYLFDPDDSKAVEAYKATGSLFLKSQYDESGYFYYNAAENFAKFDRDSNEFTLYNRASKDGSVTNPYFMPFNDINVNGLLTSKKDYLFGMTVTADFIQPKAGQTVWKGNDPEDMKFEFTGDDDVWVFIDDVLILDMGALHAAASGTINFAKGTTQVTNNGAESNSGPLAEQKIYDLMEKVKPKEWLDANFTETKDGDWIFKDYTTHTMKFYYLERGSGKSNCKIKFNLQTIPAGTINFQKELSYANVQYAEDLEFIFKTFVYSEETKKYELYKGPYEVYKAGDESAPIETGTAMDGTISLKHHQLARLTGEEILDNSKFYIQEMGATSDKYEVTIDNTKVDIVDENGNVIGSGGESGVGVAAQSKKMTVSDNRLVVFTNSVSQENFFNLNIAKEMAEGQSSDDIFTMEVVLGGVPYAGAYQIFNSNGIKVDDGTAVDGRISLKADQYAQISGLVGGTHIEVTEKDLGSNYEDPTYALTGQADQITTTAGIGAVAHEGKELGDNPEVTITVTNSLKFRSLKVKKIVDGNMGDPDKEFTFTATNGKTNVPLTGYLYTKTGTNGAETTGTLPKDGTFTLKHGETIEIQNLPANMTVVVEESENSAAGYTTTYSTDDGETYSGEGRTYTHNVNAANNLVVFKNEKDIDVPTGIFTNRMPYLMMLAMAAIGLTGFALHGKAARKRRDDE